MRGTAGERLCCPTRPLRRQATADHVLHEASQEPRRGWPVNVPASSGRQRLPEGGAAPVDDDAGGVWSPMARAPDPQAGDPAPVGGALARSRPTWDVASERAVADADRRGAPLVPSDGPSSLVRAPAHDPRHRGRGGAHPRDPVARPRRWHGAALAHDPDGDARRDPWARRGHVAQAPGDGAARSLVRVEIRRGRRASASRHRPEVGTGRSPGPWPGSQRSGHRPAQGEGRRSRGHDAASRRTYVRADFDLRLASGSDALLFPLSPGGSRRLDRGSHAGRP